MTASLAQQRQAIEGALRAFHDRKLPRSGETLAIISGLDAALATIRQVQQDERRQ